jgi:DNA-directed RNA polymerase specialized sigma24 family protein
MMHGGRDDTWTRSRSAGAQLLDSPDWEESAHAKIALRERLVRLCARLTGDPDAAEDLAQDALVVAWHERERLRDPAAYNSWVVGIAANLCRRHLRRQARA